MDKDELNRMQKEIDEIYARDGLTNEVLERQCELNRLRNKYNIPDESELDGLGYAQ